MATIFCNGSCFTNIQAVFLDKDGTLANVAIYLKDLGLGIAQRLEQALPGTYDYTLKALGVTPEGVTASGLLAIGSRQETIMGTATAATMVGLPWLQAVDIAAALITAADQRCTPKAAYTPLLPGALEFLQRLRQVKLKVIMVSADSQHNLEQFVQYHQLQVYFDNLQGISKQHPAKTAPDFLSAACQTLGLTPQQGLVIGDSATDLRMAEPARGFIGYLGGWQPVLSPRDILSDTSASCSDHGFATAFEQITLQLT